MIPFVKAHACGNDFLIVEETVAGRDHAALARKLCSRNTSIGADGIEFLERRANAEFFLRLFNADGKRGGTLRQWHALRSCVAGAERGPA